MTPRELKSIENKRRHAAERPAFLARARAHHAHGRAIMPAGPPVGHLLTSFAQQQESTTSSSSTIEKNLRTLDWTRSESYFQKSDLNRDQNLTLDYSKQHGAREGFENSNGHHPNHTSHRLGLNSRGDDRISPGHLFPKMVGEAEMTNLTGRPVQSKAEVIEENRLRKAQRRSDSGKAVKERVKPQGEGEILKAKIIANISASGHEAAEGFLAEFSSHHWKVFTDGRIELWWQERKAGKQEGEIEMQHKDYVDAWVQLGADPGKDPRWSSEAILSARRVAKLFRQTPNGDWTAIRDIVAKLGTCAWLWHIGGIHGDTVEVLHAQAYEGRQMADQKWATYVASELSKITGKELKGEPCHLPWIGISHRRVR